MVRRLHSSEALLAKAFDALELHIDQDERTEVYLRVVDLFLSEDAPTAGRERMPLLNAIKKLTPLVTETARDQMIARVAARRQPASDLVTAMVQDDIARVGALLKSSDLDEDQLIEIVEATGYDHHSVIASRIDVPTNVWILLNRRKADPIKPEPKEEPLSLAAYRMIDAEAGKINSINEMIQEIKAATETLTQNDTLNDELIESEKAKISKNLTRLQFLARS